MAGSNVRLKEAECAIHSITNDISINKITQYENLIYLKSVIENMLEDLDREITYTSSQEGGWEY